MVKRGNVNLKDASQWRTIGDEAEKLGRVRMYTKEEVFFAPIYIALAANLHRGADYSAEFFAFPEHLTVYQKRFNRRKKDVLDLKKSFNPPTAVFGKNVYGDRSFEQTLNAYEAWTNNEMNGARTGNSREMVPYLSRKQFEARWKLLNKFCYSFISYNSHYNTKKEALKACKQLFNNYCDWDEGRRMVKDVHVEKVIQYMRKMALHKIFFIHLRQLHKETNTTIRGPNGLMLFLDEKKALHVFTCFLQRLCPALLPKNEEKDILACMKDWLQDPKTGKQTRKEFKWLKEMETVSAHERRQAILNALMQRNSTRMDCIMYLHHQQIEATKELDAKRAQEAAEKQRQQALKAKEKAHAQRKDHWLKKWKEEDERLQDELGLEKQVKAYMSTQRERLPLLSSSKPTDEYQNKQTQILMTMRHLIEHCYTSRIFEPPAFVGPCSVDEGGLSPQSCQVGLLLCFFREQWTLSPVECDTFLKTWLPPVFVRDFNRYTVSFFQLSVCADPTVRKGALGWLDTNGATGDALPIANEILRGVSRFIHERHVLQACPLRRQEPAPKNPVLCSDATAKQRPQGAGDSHFLWDPTGPKGLNRTEKAREAEINERFLLFGYANDIETDKPAEVSVANSKSNHENNDEKDPDWEWRQFCLEFDATNEATAGGKRPQGDKNDRSGGKKKARVGSDDESDGFNDSIPDTDSDEDSTQRSLFNGSDQSRLTISCDGSVTIGVEEGEHEVDSGGVRGASSDDVPVPSEISCDMMKANVVTPE